MGTFAVAAGSNRLLVVAIASTRTTAGSQTVSSVTYGGQALTLAAGDGTSTVTWNHSYLYYLNEAGIAAAVGTSLNVTITGGTSYYTWVYSAVYAGVDQSTPFTSARNYNSATANTAVGPFSPTLTIASGDQAVEIVNQARSTTGTTARTISTWATGWTTAGVAPASIVTSGPTATLYIRDRNVLTAASDGSQHTADNSGTWDSMTAMSIKPYVDPNAHTYTVTPLGTTDDTGVIPDQSGAGGCGATNFWNVRYFLVNEHFTVNDLNVRFDVTHATRGQVQMTLTSPPDASGTRVSQVLVPTASDSLNNYDILLDADTGGTLGGWHRGHYRRPG